MTDFSPSDGSVPARLITSEGREAAVKRLTAAFAEDAIAVEEFERRVAAVYKATSSETLAALTRDLPTGATGGSSVPARAEASRAVDGSRARSRRIASVFSAIERDVAGPMPEILHVRAVMGSVELDLRDAEFPPGLTEIRVRSVMGSVEIDLPDTVRIENDGKAFMGSWVVSSRRRRGRERPADGPVVRITGRSIMASVEVGVDD
ncbi:MAG: DUF1707 domain-containing protein [Gemmatimonadetes bacterium]|nr:DUF1707 domain-containing protein [Gemmatimonadota bacterium]